jgi:hypothetical protein
MVEIPSSVHFLKFVLITVGRHLQQLGDELRLVFDSLHIVCDSLTKKVFYVKPKMLPYLI